MEFLNITSINTVHISNGEVSQGCQVTRAVAKLIIREQDWGVRVGGYRGYLDCHVDLLNCQDVTFYSG
jgi:hypothetical protein